MIPVVAGAFGAPARSFMPRAGIGRCSLMQTRSEQTRQALVRAAAELIANGKLSDAGLVNICRRAGVSRGALYHHFSSTAELTAAVYEQAHERVVALMDEAFEGPVEDAPERLLVALCEALRTEELVRAADSWRWTGRRGRLGCVTTYWRWYAGGWSTRTGTSYRRLRIWPSWRWWWPQGWSRSGTRTRSGGTPRRPSGCGCCCARCSRWPGRGWLRRNDGWGAGPKGSEFRSGGEGGPLGSPQGRASGVPSRSRVRSLLKVALPGRSWPEGRMCGTRQGLGARPGTRGTPAPFGRWRGWSPGAGGALGVQRSPRCPEAGCGAVPVFGAAREGALGLRRSVAGLARERDGRRRGPMAGEGDPWWGAWPG